MENTLEPLARALGGRRLILHAGTPKTGTTSLQSWLMLNREGLRQQGVLYPSNVFRPDKPKHQWIVDSLQRGNPTLIAANADSIRDQLAEESPVDIHTIILSTEGIYNHFHEVVIPHQDSWMQLAKSCPINIVVTLRNPMEFALSRYRQNLINPPSNHPFHATIESLDALCLNPDWLLSLDYLSFVEFWEKALEPQSVICIPYNRISPFEFCRATGIDIPSRSTPAMRENVSFGRLGVELIRAVNNIGLPVAQRNEAIQQVLSIEKSMEQQNLPPFSHTPTSSECIRRYCRDQSIKLLASHPELTLELRVVANDFISSHTSPERQLPADILDTAFICCIQPGFLEDQTVVLCQSIRLFGGKYKHAPIYAISPCGENLNPACSRTLESLGVTIVIKPLNEHMRSFKYANKAYALEYAESAYSHHTNIFLDSDTLFLGEPIAFELDPFTDFLARPVDLRGVCRSAIDDDFAQYWQTCCDIAGITLLDLPVITTTVDQVPIYSNWNGGLLVTRGNKAVGRKWREVLEELWKSRICAHPQNFWGSGQVSFTLATASLGLSGQILPEGYNIPLHLDPIAARINQIEQPLHIHYHWMLENDSHREAVRRIKLMNISSAANHYISNLKPFASRRGDSCTGFESNQYEA
jgi:hypothetical protein